MARSLARTNPNWIPTSVQLDAIDMQASGYSLSAISRTQGIPIPTIWSWNNETSFAAQYRELVAKRAQEFHEAKEAVHSQQVVMALQIIQDALSGEMQRDPVGTDGAIAPLRYEAAVQLLRATFWKQQTGGYKRGNPGAVS